jgi:hypothetical protein
MAYISSGSAQTAGSSVYVETFTAGADFTAGSSSSVTLANAPASENSVWVMFNGVVQHHTEYSLNNLTITFTAVIPANVTTIEVQVNTQLAVGVPGDATVDYSKLTSAAKTTLQRKNAIINGNFDIWQRATSQTSVGYGSADRWKTWFTGTSVTLSVSQQAFALGQTAVPNEPEFFMRNTFASGSDVSTIAQTYQQIEDVRTFAGQTITLSFWAKSSTSLDMALEIQQNFGSGGTPSDPVYATPEKISLTTSWVKYTMTRTLGSVSGKTIGTDDNDSLIAVFTFTAGSDNDARTDTLGLQTGTIDIAQVQVEKGSEATNFERRHIADELALCHRYYQTLYFPLFFAIGFGRGTGSTTARTHIYHLQTPMRAVPSGNTSTSGDIAVHRVDTGVDVSSAQNVAIIGNTYNSWYANVTVTIPAANASYRIHTTATAFTATFDAEL